MTEKDDKLVPGLHGPFTKTLDVEGVARRGGTMAVPILGGPWSLSEWERAAQSTLPCVRRWFLDRKMSSMLQ